MNENNLQDIDMDGLTPSEQRMASETMHKLIIKYSIPTIIGMLVNALYNVVDRFWVGQIKGIGSLALTGLGLTMPVTNILLACAMLVGIGAATNISIYLGKRSRGDAEKILGNTLVYIIGGGIILTIIGLVFIEDILMLVGADSETLPYALEYSRIIIGGCIFQQISFAMNHPIRAAGNPKRFASTQLIGAIANMILDPVFIFVFGWGIKGAAAATIISQLISAVWVLSYYFTGNSPLKLKFVNLKPNLFIAKRIYSLGLSSFLMNITASIVSIVANKTLIFYGELEIGSGNIAVGAMTVISSVMMLITMPIVGIYQGMSPIIGFNFGAGNMKRVRSAYKWGVVYGVSLGIAGLIAVESFAPWLIRIFNDDALLISVGAVGMRIFLMALPAAAFQITSNALFLAIGRAKMSIFLSMLRQAILLIPFYIILPRLFGFNGIWFAGPFADIIAAVITGVLVRRVLYAREK